MKITGFFKLIILNSVIVRSAIFLLLFTPVVSRGSALANDKVVEIAEAITVRIEGATQGSGIIVSRDVGEYTVLTAWHVVKGINEEEEVDIYTFDGVRHPSNGLKIQRVGNVDLAKVIFRSNNDYQIADAIDVSTAKTGRRIFVSGYPLSTTSVPQRILRFSSGEIIANTSSTIPDGYQILYSNITYPGMSGGPVLDSSGRLIAVHGRAETDYKFYEQAGFAVKTGTNQGVPINYFISFNQDSSRNILSLDSKIEISSLMTTAYSLLREQGPSRAGANNYHIVDFNGNEREVINISNQILEKDPSNYYGYILRGQAYQRLRHGACEQLGKRRDFVPFSDWATCQPWKEPHKTLRAQSVLQALNDYQAAQQMDESRLEPLERQLKLLDKYSYEYSNFLPVGLRKEIISLLLAIEPSNVDFLTAKAELSNSCMDLLDALYLGSMKIDNWLAPIRSGNNRCLADSSRFISPQQVSKGIRAVNQSIRSNMTMISAFSTKDDMYPDLAFNNPVVYKCSSYRELRGLDECRNVNKGTGEYQAGMAYKNYLNLLKLRGTMKIYSGDIEGGCLDYNLAYQPMANYNYFPKYELGFWDSHDVCRPPQHLRGNGLVSQISR